MSSASSTIGTEGERKAAQSAGVGSPWSAFVGARGNEEFYRAWLPLLCERLRGVNVGVLLLRSGSDATFTPVALWPASPRDLSFLGSIAQQALSEGKGVVRRANETPTAPIQLAYPLGEAEHLVGAVVIEASARPDADAQALLRELHWGLGWLQHILVQERIAESEAQLARVGSIMEIVSTALQPTPLRQSLLELCNQIARRLNCSRAVIGLTDRGKATVSAISDAAWFEANATLAKHYAHAMEDVLDQLETITYRRTLPEVADDQPAPEAATSIAFSELARAANIECIVGMPLLLGDKCVGVLIVERNEPNPFNESEMIWLQALTSLLPGAIDQKQRADRGFFKRLTDDTRWLMSRFFGHGHLVWKTAGALAIAIIAALALIEMDYRVTAKTVIEGETQRSVVAPFQGFIAQSLVRAGDVVKKDQLLCTLDDRDLLLEKAKWASEKEQRVRELTEAMAKHDLTQTQIISAQVQQADAQLTLAEERLSRAQILAPMDGLVISGDLSQLIGSPVEQGKKLFELAPLTNYRVILQVDESEIQHVAVGQTGKLIVTGMTETMPLAVSKVTPVATAEDGVNYFRVEASLQGAPVELRPGMEGVGKVSVGDRRLWWILTHSFTDRLRVWLWRWLP